jgi:hypothetical protein
MRRHFTAILAGCALASAATPVLAQDEIVVTASRLKEYDPQQTPQVTLKRRADNLIVAVTVVCDTRDQSQRRDELKQTLRNMIRAAEQDRAIDLGLGDEVVGAFDESMLDAVITPDARADTSRAVVVIKTPVRADDTFDGATGRIQAFVKRTTKMGRTEILLDDDWQLTLVNPQQYRPDVARLVAEDARRMAALFGEGYGVEAQNLQLPVSWYQAGPLDLALYIPYRLTVRPVR